MFARTVASRAAGLSRAFSSRTWPSVTIVGVGQMGAAVAGNLLRNNVSVTLHDMHGDKNVPDVLRPSLEGATWIASAKEAAAASDVIITALPRPEHVTAAFESEGGLLEGMRAGQTWIEHSTTDFRNTMRVKELVEAKGSHCVEAPLTGGMQILREGKMVSCIGASDEVFEGEVASLVALSAPRLVRCGEFGHATIIKVWSNVLCAAMDVHVGECLATCKKAGLDMRLVFDAMRCSSGNSFCWETEVPLVLKGEYDPNFTAAMMLKDIDLTLDLTERYGVPAPITSHIGKIFQEAIDAYGADAGSTIPVKLNEDASGCVLSEGPGNAKDAFKDWSYTTTLNDGSYQVVHQDYKNQFLEEPFTLHSDTINPAQRIQELTEQVAALEQKLARFEQQPE